MPKPGDELRNPLSGQTIRFVEISADVLVLESGYRAGAPPAPPHLHPAQEERFAVLSGAVRVGLDGEERMLAEGDELTVAPGTPHEFGGHPDSDGRIRWETRPALRTAEFLEAVFGLSAADPEVQGREGPALLEEYSDVFRLA